MLMILSKASKDRDSTGAECTQEVGGVGGAQTLDSEEEGDKKIEEAGHKTHRQARLPVSRFKHGYH